MEKKHARRLLKLADFLMTVPRERFDLGVWVGEDWKGKPDLSCGTTACAVGWAATMPMFRRLGLRLQRPAFSGTEYPAEPCLVSNGKRTHGECGTIREIFGDEAGNYALFMPEGLRDENGKIMDSTSPKQMAKRIREFVKAHA